MKKRFLVASIAVILSAVFFTNPFIIFLAKKQLKQIFKGSVVSIKSSVFNPFSSILLRDIEIRRMPYYEIRIKEVVAGYSVPSLFKLTILSAQIKEASVKIDLGKKDAVDLMARYLEEMSKREKSRLKLKMVSVSGLGVKLNSADLSLQAKADLDIDPSGAVLKSVRLGVASLTYRGVNLSESSLFAAEGSGEGKLHIKKVKYNKFSIEEIGSKAGLKDNVLSLEGLRGRLFDGDISGNAALELKEGIGYRFEIGFSNLDLERYIKDAELEKELTLTGRLTGSLTIEGKGPVLSLINGSFSASEPGGTLTIKDDRVLKNMARKSGQSLDILVEGLKDYHYNVGKTKLLLDGRDLVWQSNMDGEEGKRNFTVVVHDFKL